MAVWIGLSIWPSSSRPSLKPGFLCQRGVAFQPPFPVTEGEREPHRVVRGWRGLRSLSEAGCISTTTTTSHPQGPCLTNPWTGGNSLAALVHSDNQPAGPQSVPALRAEITSACAVCFLRLALTLTGCSGGTELSEGIKAPTRHPHALRKLLTQHSFTEIARIPLLGQAR